MTSDSLSRTKFLQQWLGLEELVDPPTVAWDVLPDPDDENWFRSAVLRAHKTLRPELCLQAIFGLAVPLQHPSFGSGDWLCEQIRGKTRGRALCVHDERYTWADGGPAGYDVETINDFVSDWLEREDSLDHLGEALDELAEELDDEAGDTDALLEGLPDDLREVANDLLTQYRQALPMGGHVPDIIGALAINELLAQLVPEEHEASPSAVIEAIRPASWIVAGLAGEPGQLPAGQGFDDWKATIERWVANPESADKSGALLNLWAAFFLDVEVAGAVANMRGHAWRVLRDAATLIEALLEDPKIGAVELVRRPDLAEG